MNAATDPDCYSLPHISDLLDKTSGKVCFSSLDLTKAYYQVPVLESDIPKTVIATPLGLCEYTLVLVYLDDILIASDSWDSHSATVRKVLTLRESTGLVFNTASFTSVNLVSPKSNSWVTLFLQTEWFLS